MSKIVLIEDTTWSEGKWRGYDGYRIVCDDGKDVKMGISNDQNCCENWGYLTSEDDLQKYVGAELLSVKVVDEALNVETCPDVYEGGVTFINVETSKGMFQFVAYNEHNGHYSHDCVLIENGVSIHEEYL